MLPRVTLKDVPDDLKYPQGESRSVGSMPACWYKAGTNGMAYKQLVTQLPDFDEELTKILPYYAMSLAEVGSAGRSYIETQAEQASVLGGLGARISTRSALNKSDEMHAVMILSSKGLNRNLGHITRLIEETMESPDFSEVDRIGDLISQSRARVENSITGRGHALASAAASSRMRVHLQRLTTSGVDCRRLSILKIWMTAYRKTRTNCKNYLNSFVPFMSAFVMHQESG